jgi:hypothetical protein
MARPARSLVTAYQEKSFAGEFAFAGELLKCIIEYRISVKKR